MQDIKKKNKSLTMVEELQGENKRDRERTFTLELTKAELEELDCITYDVASFERCKATFYERDMNETVHSLRGKVITLINEAKRKETKNESVGN